MDFSKQLAHLQQNASRAVEAAKENDKRSASASPQDGIHERRYHPYRNTPQRHHHRDGNHTFTSEEEFYLPRLIKSIPKYHPVLQAGKTITKPRHIALLFLTLEDIPLYNIWETFFGTLSKDSDLMISVIVHAKFPDKVKSDWTRQRLLIHKPSRRDLIQSLERSKANRYVNDQALPPARYFSRRPEWGSVEITRAMMDLLEEGLRIGTQRDETPSILQDNQEYISRFSSRRYVSNISMPKSLKDLSAPIPTVDRFVFLSETCMPVCTMDELELSFFGSSSRKEDDASSTTPPSRIYHGLDAEKSWLKAIHKPNNGYARQLQWDAIFSIPPENIWKADQWISLTRHHAWPMVSLLEDAVENVQKEAIEFSHGSSRDRSQSRVHVAPWQCFRRVKASDEMYFPTIMSLLGILKEDSKEKSIHLNTETDPTLSSTSDEVAFRRMTYCDWSMNARNPATFIISKEDDLKALRRVIALAREERCLFARKLVLQGSIEESRTRGDVYVSKDNPLNEIITGKEWLEFISKHK